jgi:hypothetical protein
MRTSSTSIGMVVAMLAAFALPSALRAHDAKSPSGEESSPARPGMRMEGMDKMMDHCMRMMQGGSIRPNDQWRDGPPPVNGAKKP